MQSVVRPWTRRAVLAGMAGSALAPLEARTSDYSPRLAVQTGVFVPLPDNLEPVFSAISRAGLRLVHLEPDFLRPAVMPAVWRELRSHGLQAAVCSVGAGPPEPALLESLGQNGVEWVESRPGEPRALDRLGLDVQRFGLRLLVRSDAASMRDGARAWRAMVRATDPDLLHLAIDADAAAQVGIDPVKLIEEHSDRVSCVALRSRREGRLLEEIASGEPDMQRVAAALRRVQYTGILTIDLPAVPNRVHTVAMAMSHSRWYVEEVFGTRQGMRPADLGPHVRTRRQ